MTENLVAVIAALDDPTSERLLQAVLEAMLQSGESLLAGDEHDARELVAATVALYPDEVVPTTEDPVEAVRRALLLVAADPTTAPLVSATLDALPDETQMFADPVTAAIVLAVLVAFLQTKFDLKVSRKSGKVDVELKVSKQSTSDETVAKVLDAVRRAATGG